MYHQVLGGSARTTDVPAKLIGAITSGPAPILRRTEVKGYIVSTVVTPDQGPETAILDRNHAYPVERYETPEAAREGHKAWVRVIEGGLKEIDKLGYDDFTEPRRIVLVPMETIS